MVWIVACQKRTNQHFQIQGRSLECSPLLFQWSQQTLLREFSIKYSAKCCPLVKKPTQWMDWEARINRKGVFLGEEEKGKKMCQPNWKKIHMPSS